MDRLVLGVGGAAVTGIVYAVSVVRWVLAR